MPTTAELRVMQGRQHGLLFLIDGCETGFCNTRALVGYDTGADHDVVIGLMRDISFVEALDLPSGQFDDNPAHVTIHDVDDVLPALFKAFDDTEQDLGDVPFGAGTPIAPSEDLTARTDLHDLNVGIERIGTAGERHQFAVPPGFDIGLDHAIAVPSSDLAGSPVSETPVVWKGRRCVLYRIYRDHVTYPDRSVGLTAWRPMSEAVKLWQGTLRDQAEINGREWKLNADGPESWVRKPLAIGWQTDPVRCVGDVTLLAEENNDERQIAVRLFAGVGGADSYGTSVYIAPLTDGTVDELRDQVIQVIADAAAAAGIDGTWDAQPGFHVSMEDDSSVRIGVADGEGLGFMQVELSRKMWTILGYDVVDQPKLDQDPDDARALNFDQLPNNGYSDDYWLGTFPTGREGWPATEDNGGITRLWRPLYDGGNHVLLAGLNNNAGQVVRLGIAAEGGGTTSVMHPGQLDQPIAADAGGDPVEIDGTPCNRQGYWLFKGKRRYIDTEEEFDEWWVGRACWVSGVAQEDRLVANDTILVVEWFDARAFGFPRGKPNSDWIARTDLIDGEEKGTIYAVPIVSLGYTPGSGFDRADRVMQRLLLSTGTSSGWDAAGFGAELDAGDNEPTNDDAIIRDAELAPLGLGVPEDFVQPVTAWDAEVDLVDDPAILDVRVAFSAGYQAEDVFQSLMQPVGWCWHMRGGRYGVFCPAHAITHDDVEVVLDRSTKAKTYAQQEQEISSGVRKATDQKLRAYAPVDEWVANFNWAPYLNKAQGKLNELSPDKGLRYRPGAVPPRQVLAHHHRSLGGITIGGWRQRVAFLAKWWARRHFWVKNYLVHLVDPGEDCHMGTVVQLTDPEIVHPDGTRGVTNALGYITRAATDLGQGSKLLDMLILDRGSSSPFLNAPMARGWGYNTSTRRLYVRDNEWAIQNADGTWSDATAFVEQTIAGQAAIGGHAGVKCLQWNGSTWAENLDGDVESIVTTPGGAYLQLENGTVSGTYFRDMDTIVVLQGRVSHGQDAAWAIATYAPICDEDGNFDEGTGDEAGFNWEP